MSGDDQDKPKGMRDVYQGADGGYYVEQSPGSGPRHHDDLPLTPADVERKAHDQAAPDSLEGMVPAMGPAGAGEDPRTAYLVIGDGEGFGRAFPPGQQARAAEYARNTRGVLVTLPVLADFREGM